MNRPLRTVAIALAVLVAASALVDRLAPASPSGAPSSSYATQPRGLAAYHDVLERAGHPVRRLRIAPSERRVPSRETVVVLDPAGLPDADARALLAFVDRGGRLVAGGTGATAWLRRLLGETRPRAAATTAPVRASAPLLAGVGAVVASPGASLFADAGRGLPVVTAPGGAALVLAATRGDGRAFVLSDASPLQNTLLAAAGNASLGLALAGRTADGSPRPVAFLETVHGFGRPTGLGALPPGWRAALLGLAGAALVFVLARGRRIGAAEEVEPDWPPPRVAYVDALAAILERTGRPGEVAEPLRAAARERIARRAQLGPEPDAEALDRAARALGLTDAERSALHGGDGDEALLAAARALARA